MNEVNFQKLIIPVIFLGLCLFNTASLLAQPQYAHEILTRQNGLSDNRITAFAQDKTGYLWIGTSSGLNRFDGQNFKVFRHDYSDENSLSENYITCLLNDSDNNIWVGLKTQGIGKFNPTTGVFKKFKELPVGPINCLFEDRDHFIWIGYSRDGMYRVNPKTAAIEHFSLLPFINKNYLEQDRRSLNSVLRFVEDKQSNIWIGTHGGLYKFSPNTQKLTKEITVSNYLGDELHSSTGVFTYNAVEEYLQIIRANQFIKYFINSSKIESHEYVNSEGKNFTLGWADVRSRDDSTIWITSKANGLGILNSSSNRIDFNVVQSVNPIEGRIFSTKGFLWIGTDAGVVKIYEVTNPFGFFPLPGRNKESRNEISDIYADEKLKKRFYASEYGDGLLISDWSGKNFRYFKNKIPEGADQYSVISQLLNIDSTFILVMARDHIQLFNKKLERWEATFEDGAKHTKRKYFDHAHKDKTGNIWIGSFNDGIRLLKLPEFRFEIFKKDNKKIESDLIRGIVEDPWGQIWAATADKGLFIYDANKKEFISYNALNSGAPLKISVFESMTITSDSSIWLGSITNGILKIKLKEKNLFVVEEQSNPIFQGSFHYVVADDRDRVWAVGLPGVLEIDVRKNITNYWSSTIYPISKTLEFINLILSDGKPFIGTYNGYYCVLEEELKTLNTEQAKLVINSLKIDGEETAVKSTGDSSKIEVPFSKNSLQIEFSSIDFSSSSLRQYSYKLEGWDKNWINVSSSQKIASYAHLRGGDYVFKLRSSNPSGLKSEEKSLLFFKVETPFWQRPLFWFACLILIIVMIYLIYKMRIKRLLKEESYKKEIIDLQLIALRNQMNPHFIFNSLNTIQGLVIRNDLEVANKYLTQFSKLLRRILQNSENNFITVSEEMETLTIFLSAQAIRFTNKFTYEITDEGSLSDLAIPSMVVQPILENVIWKLLGVKQTISEINIRFERLPNGGISTVIQDNCIFDIDSSNGQSSLSGLDAVKNTKHRLEMLSAKSSVKHETVYDEQGNRIGNRITINF